MDIRLNYRNRQSESVLIGIEQRRDELARLLDKCPAEDYTHITAEYERSMIICMQLSFKQR